MSVIVPVETADGAFVTIAAQGAEAANNIDDIKASGVCVDTTSDYHWSPLSCT